MRFRRGKGGKTLLVALHRDARTAVEAYLADGRPALVGDISDEGDPGHLFLTSFLIAGVSDWR
jgi:site-specific recombinase XerD